MSLHLVCRHDDDDCQVPPAEAKIHLWTHRAAADGLQLTGAALHDRLRGEPEDSAGCAQDHSGEWLDAHPCMESRGGSKVPGNDAEL